MPLIDSVLYSRQGCAWKVADFGLTTEGSGTNPIRTVYARGTSSYRAPELLIEDHAVFSNKVDIWSLGCILYELSVGRKAFADDFAILTHSQLKTPLNITLQGFDDIAVTCISNKILDMLQVDPTLRPSSSTLLQDFNQYCLPRNQSAGYVDIHLDLQHMQLTEQKNIVSESAIANQTRMFFLICQSDFVLRNEGRWEKH